MYIRYIYTPNPTKEDDEYVETPCTGIGGNEWPMKPHSCFGWSCHRTVSGAQKCNINIKMGIILSNRSI